MTDEEKADYLEKLESKGTNLLNNRNLANLKAKTAKLAPILSKKKTAELEAKAEAHEVHKFAKKFIKSADQVDVSVFNDKLQIMRVMKELKEEEDQEDKNKPDA
ncbi:MAG TPA: hypothetical protein DCE41_33270 [Cytophagales bacterium]|nr:hypothetical protein [Cytophagales bacterium]HAA22142.1 hypothetical protein [Cytophagales bacterium]HAP65069.1 hypothetical protein [Cytophagales bacterium]